MKKWLIIVILTALGVTAPATQRTHHAGIAPGISVFVQALTPYGSWLHLHPHGLVWRPNLCITTPGWQPYRDGGRWIEDSCGLRWTSDYAWGWATFHYGRWLSSDRYGWLWVPGDEWAPAWVEWRNTESLYGWAPLPPTGSSLHVQIDLHGRCTSLSAGIVTTDHAFVFVPRRRIFSRHVITHCPPQRRTAHIYTPPPPAHPDRRPYRAHHSTSRRSTTQHAVRTRAQHAPVVTHQPASAPPPVRHASQPAAGRTSRLHQIVRTRFRR